MRNRVEGRGIGTSRRDVRQIAGLGREERRVRRNRRFRTVHLNPKIRGVSRLEVREGRIRRTRIAARIGLRLIRETRIEEILPRRARQLGRASVVERRNGVQRGFRRGVQVDFARFAQRRTEFRVAVLVRNPIAVQVQTDELLRSEVRRRNRYEVKEPAQIEAVARLLRTRVEVQVSALRADLIPQTSQLVGVFVFVPFSIHLDILVGVPVVESKETEGTEGAFLISVDAIQLGEVDAFGAVANELKSEATRRTRRNRHDFVRIAEGGVVPNERFERLPRRSRIDVAGVQVVRIESSIRVAASVVFRERLVPVGVRSPRSPGANIIEAPEGVARNTADHRGLGGAGREIDFTRSFETRFIAVALKRARPNIRSFLGGKTRRERLLRLRTPLARAERFFKVELVRLIGVVVVKSQRGIASELDLIDLILVRITIASRKERGVAFDFRFQRRVRVFAGENGQIHHVPIDRDIGIHQRVIRTVRIRDALNERRLVPRNGSDAEEFVLNDRIIRHAILIEPGNDAVVVSIKVFAIAPRVRHFKRNVANVSIGDLNSSVRRVGAFQRRFRLSVVRVGNFGRPKRLGNIETLPADIGDGDHRLVIPPKVCFAERVQIDEGIGRRRLLTKPLVAVRRRGGLIRSGTESAFRRGTDDEVLVRRQVRRTVAFATKSAQRVGILACGAKIRNVGDGIAFRVRKPQNTI